MLEGPSGYADETRGFLRSLETAQVAVVDQTAGTLSFLVGDASGSLRPAPGTWSAIGGLANPVGAVVGRFAYTCTGPVCFGGSNTGRSCSKTGGGRVPDVNGCGWHLNCAVKANVLPRPGSLSTVIFPPIEATSRLAIVRPRPVPPYN